MEKVKQELEQVIKDLFGVDFSAELTEAPEGVEADLATNAAMKLAKVLHKNPTEIATEIKNRLDKSGLFLVSVEVPGFLNFILPDEYFLGEMSNFGDDFPKNISRGEYSGQTIICEFSDPNPFKVLHVGHLYTSVVGDAISRLFELMGAKVIRANFGGDVGLHVAKTIWAICRELQYQPFLGEELGETRAELEKITIGKIAECYTVGTRAYEDDETARAEIVKINQAVFKIAAEELGRDVVNHEFNEAAFKIATKELGRGVAKHEYDRGLAEIYWWGRELSYKYFEQFYDSIGVKFDRYYPESTVALKGMEEVRRGLREGVYEESDGAVVYKGEKEGLHTRVFINKVGLPTYEAKDVGLIFTKWADYGFDRSVIITGNDIVDYMKVILASVEKLNPDFRGRTTHLTHGQVKLPGSVKMSSRKGNFLKAVDVIDMVARELEEGYGSKDRKVVMGAVKYAFLKYKMGGDIVFDLKESVKMTGNSGPYLLYSVVRAKKILGKVETNGEWGNAGKLDEFEKKLARKMVQYGRVLAEAGVEMAPHKLAGFLYELAQEFSRFYENCPVAGSENEGQRVKLVAIYTKIMEHGLGILGIEVPEEM